MQHVLIIGATSDVAKACAHLYAKNHYRLSLAGRNLVALQLLAKDIHIRYGVSCECLELDVLDISKHQTFVDSLIDFPEITLCFAGYLGNQQQALHKWDETERILQTNFTGVVSVINRLIVRYEQRGSGTIAVLSSVAGERGRQSNYFYGSAKAGLSAYLSGLRNQLASVGVHVISVKPGFIATKMTEGIELPKLLTASPEQVAQAIFKGVRKKKNTVYVLGIWRYIMLIIKAIPESIFKKLKL